MDIGMLQPLPVPAIPMLSYNQRNMKHYNIMMMMMIVLIIMTHY